MVTFIFYHKADLDGFVSGYLLKKHICDTNEYKNYANTLVLNGPLNLIDIASTENVIYCRPYNYNDLIDIDEIKKAKDKMFDVKVYFVDCSPYQTDGYFCKLYDLLGDDLIMIDHHVTSLKHIDDFEETNYFERGKVKGLRSSDYSGCELTAMYIMDKSFSDEQSSRCDRASEMAEAYKKVPEFVKLLGRHDIHDIQNKEFSWNMRILPFQYGFRSKVPDLNDIVSCDDTIEGLLTIYSPEIIQEVTLRGEAVLNYITGRNKTVLTEYGHKGEVCFLSGEDVVEILKRVYWVTDYCNNTLIFGDDFCDKDAVYILIKQNLRKKNYTISLYTTSEPESEIDVSDIASRMGGGGHKHASGFTASYVKYSETDDTLYITK